MNETAAQFLEESIKEVGGYKDVERDSDAIKMWDELRSTLENTHSVMIGNLGAGA